MEIPEVILEWQIEALVALRKKDIPELLSIRFGPLPEDLVQQIARADDLETLERWFQAAICSESLDDFRSRIADIDDPTVITLHATKRSP